MNRTKRLITVATCLLGVAFAGTAVAAADSTPATLSSVEFQQITQLKVALESSPASVAALNKLLGVCRHTSGATALLRSEKGDCAKAITTTKISVGLAPAVKHCESLSVQSQGLFCLIKPYNKLYLGVRSKYRADVALYRTAKHRGFAGRCLTVLSYSTTTLTDERRVVALVLAVEKALKRGNETAVGEDSGREITLSAKLEADNKNSPKSMTLCAHVAAS